MGKLRGVIPSTKRLALLAGAVVAVCPSAARASAPELTTFGYGNSRDNVSPAAWAIPSSAVNRLGLAWRTHVDGAINTQPVTAQVTISGRPRRLIYVGTEHGVAVALDAATGAIVWQRRLGTRIITPDCQASPDGRFGITGTFVLDPAAGRLYAVDATGLGWALSLVDGHVLPGWPVRIHPDAAEFVWGGGALAGGRLYETVASMCDEGHYLGGVVAVDVRSPRRQIFWRTVPGPRAFAGGIWGWGGASVDDANGTVYVESGNSLGSPGEAAGYGERVIRLSANLDVEQSNYPIRPPFAISDRDFGGTPVLFDALGCPAQLVALNKTGELFLYDTTRISRGAVQRIRVAAADGAVPLYGMPAYDPATRTLLVGSPTSPPGGRLKEGLQAFRLTNGCRLVPLWQDQDPSLAGGSVPTIAGDVVYIEPGRSGSIYAFRLSDGQPLWSATLSRAGAFATPSLIDGVVYTADWSGNVWAFRPGGAHVPAAPPLPAAAAGPAAAALPRASARGTRLVILAIIAVVVAGLGLVLRRRT